jgi:hypothetical protein
MVYSYKSYGSPPTVFQSLVSTEADRGPIDWIDTKNTFMSARRVPEECQKSARRAPEYCDKTIRNNAVKSMNKSITTMRIRSDGKEEISQNDNQEANS